MSAVVMDRSCQAPPSCASDDGYAPYEEQANLRSGQPISCAVEHDNDQVAPSGTSDDGYASYEELEERWGRPSTSSKVRADTLCCCAQHQPQSMRLEGVSSCLCVQGGMLETNLRRVKGVNLLLKSVRGGVFARAAGMLVWHTSFGVLPS